MAIGTPTERYAQSLAAQASTSVFSPASQIETGRMAFLFATAGGGKTITGVTDSTGGNTWAVDRNGNSAGPCVAICSCQVKVAIGTAATITVSFSSAVSSAHQIWVQEVAGLATSSALDKVNSDTQTNTGPASGLLGTLSQADEILWGVMRTNAASTWTNNASNTAATTATLSSPPSAVYYRIVSATTSINMGGTLGTSGTWAAAGASYKMAAYVPRQPGVNFQNPGIL